MPEIANSQIETYAARHSSSEELIFQKLARATQQKARFPQMQVGHVEGLFLKMLAKLVRAHRILEIGTFTGYSALSMAEALPPGGRLITLDIDPEATRLAREFWRKTRAGRKIALMLGPALESLKALRGPFDMVFIDADKNNYINYWEAILPKVRRGGLIAVDNVLWSGRVLSPKTNSDRDIVSFNRHACADHRVDLVLLTVRDGITLAIRK